MKISDYPHILSFTSTKSDGNIAYHVGDNPTNVDTNRAKLAQKYGYDSNKLIFMNQTHSNRVEIVDSKSTNPIDSDGVITNVPNLPIMVMVADCIPISIYDPIQNAIGVVHAGRNGTFLKILSNAIEKMQEVYKSDPQDILIEFGPSIGQCCYEVDDTLASICINSFGKQYVSKNHIDLVSINIDQATTLGVLKENITTNSVCTKCGEADYFSYRENSSCGRFASVMVIRGI